MSTSFDLILPPFAIFESDVSEEKNALTSCQSLLIDVIKLTMKIFSFIMKVRAESHFHKGSDTMRKTLCMLGVGMMVSYLLMKKCECSKSMKNSCGCKESCCDYESNGTQSSDEKCCGSYHEKVADGFEYIIDKINSIDVEGLKTKTKDAIEAIKEKVLDLKR